MVEEKYFCKECLEVMTKRHGDLTFNYDEKTKYTVVSVIHYACNKCGDKIIPTEHAERIEIADFSITLERLLIEENKPLNLLQLSEKTGRDIRFINKTAEDMGNRGIIFLDSSKPIAELTLNQKKVNWFTKFIRRLT